MKKSSMDASVLSRTYTVRKLTETDIDAVESLCMGNSLYYQYCPPMVNRDIIEEDMTALPPGVDIDAKYDVGYYKDGVLYAVMDLILGYPDVSSAWIGFFMMDAEYQHKGEGTMIINDVCSCLLKEGYQSVQLAWVKDNPQAEHFWKKNHFVPLRETYGNVDAPLIVAERRLK